MMTNRLPGGVTEGGNSYRVRKWVEGRRVQRRFRTLDEALTFLRDLEGRITVSRLREIHETGSTRVGDLVGRWFADHRRRLQPGTQFDYEWRIRHDISKIAAFDARELLRDPSILHDFYWNQLGPQSARNARTILLQAFEEAVMRKLIPENPARGQKLPSAKCADKDIPTKEEVAKMLLAAEEEDRLGGLFVRITATLGARRGRPAHSAGRTSTRVGSES
jgi:hypothetical protein